MDELALHDALYLEAASAWRLAGKAWPFFLIAEIFFKKIKQEVN